MIQNLLHNELVEAVTKAIDQAQSIVILAHVAPDGDAMGSALGMMHYIRSIAPEKQVHVVMPNGIPGFLQWMPGVSDMVIYDMQPDSTSRLIREANLLLLLDHNEPKRLDSASKAVVESAAYKVLIDHHLYPADDYADVVISKPESPSASQLVLEYILQANDMREEVLTKDAATCLCTGMMTDTGNLEFSANDPTEYELIAVLLRRGVDKEQIYKNVFHSYTENRMRLFGYCLYRKMKIYPKYHTALITLTKEEMKRFWFQSGDAEGLVNQPLLISNIYYSVFMREDVSKIKISFRSEGDRPVNEFASAFFGGGGHKNASGGESYASMEDTIKRFEDHFRDYFKKE